MCLSIVNIARPFLPERLYHFIKKNSMSNSRTRLWIPQEHHDIMLTIAIWPSHKAKELWNTHRELITNTYTWYLVSLSTSTRSPLVASEMWREIQKHWFTKDLCAIKQWTRLYNSFLEDQESSSWQEYKKHLHLYLTYYDYQ